MNAPPSLQSGLRVCSFESRRREEMSALLQRSGARPTVAPSMREVPLEQNEQALQFIERLLAGGVDVMIFLTGVGARALLEVARSRFDRAAVLRALDRCTVVVRGPKPVAVLREWGTRIDHRAPEPNTWRELIGMLDTEAAALDGKVVAVQEYGRPNPELYAELASRGAHVLPVPVYRWALPDDAGPLADAVQRTLAGDFDVLMFTSAHQVDNVLETARRSGAETEWLQAANRCVIASIGPTCSAALREAGLPPDLEPSHPKMGHLVRETCNQAPAVLAAKSGLR
jgi:uroporphyrinogen-III synthase